MMFKKFNFDTLNKALLGLIVIAMAIGGWLWYMAAGAFLLTLVYRGYFQDAYTSRRQNDNFVGFFMRLKARFNSRRAQKVRPAKTVDFNEYKKQREAKANKRPKSDGEHKVFRCPSCRGWVRVPRGKGKIMVTCPHCSNKFEKKT